MEYNQSKNSKKKKDKKPIYLLLAFFGIFSVFIYVITRPSLQSKAIDQIQACTNVNDVKNVFDHYKFDLLENDENGNKIIASDFQDAARNKLNSFNLNDEEIKKCLEWLPSAQTSMNVIVIPDLSRRIIDTINNPNQISNDIFVLNTIWNSFVNYSKLKQDTKDRLIVDVTDIDQAKGQFGAIANELQFDLSTHKGKSNRLYFTPDKDKQYQTSIKTMYSSAKGKPLGADYRFYFRRYLPNLLKKSNLYNNYINKVVIITDGYLEAEGKVADTKIKGYKQQLDKAVDIGNVENFITSNGLNIPKEKVDLSNTDVLVCEVFERRFVPFTHITYNGKGYDFEILKAYWEDWLQRMNAHKVIFIQREQANDLTKNSIEDFLKN